MPKFGKVYEHLIKDGIASIDQFHWPSTATPALLELAHHQSYVNSYLSGAMQLTRRPCAGLGFRRVQIKFGSPNLHGHWWYSVDR